MSQLASFNFLKASDVPFLGFWSKPKSRLFRQPECKFHDLLHQHSLRESFYRGGDGVYVALVFAWLESQDRKFSAEADPIIETVRKRIEGSHWLMKFEDRRLLALIDKPMPEGEWRHFLSEVGSDGLIWASFDDARGFVSERVSEMRLAEALLISVG